MSGRRVAKVHFKHLPQITGGSLLQCAVDLPITDLITDSRKATPLKESIFFAIQGLRRDGHQFISELYRLGCRQFVVEKQINLKTYPEGNFLLVESAITALQQIVAAHRALFDFPVFGITGSNGKTIVKEWLYQLLAPDYIIVKNPGSYNSQLGVPLSVWQMGTHHNLGIFEAGISRSEEMQSLANVVKPTIGIFTNLLTAHDEGFESRKQKAEEKAKLFKSCSAVIYCKDHQLVDETVKTVSHKSQKLFTWGYSAQADVVVSRISSSECQVSFQGQLFSLPVRQVGIHKNFPDEASWENLFHVVATMLYLGYASEIIQNRIAQLKSLPMRLEMKEGVNGSTIVDDSYSNDLTGLKIALDFLKGQGSGKRLVILSDMLESGLKETEWIDQINQQLNQHDVDKLIAIGPAFSRHSERITVSNNVYQSVSDFLNGFNDVDVSGSAVLIKGARIFRLEQIVQKLQKKIHGTVMEINLGAIVHNLNAYRSRLKPETKIMAMVKAFAYGSGSHEVASILQYHKVDYLGVAYADEGKVLRANGIHLPIMVMNPTPDSFQTLIDFKLEPSVYSLTLLRSIINQVGESEMAIHVKLDTGMHRLGFEEEQLDELISLLTANPKIKVKSIYSHLAGSDDAGHDSFTDQQATQFTAMANRISTSLKISPLRHILNSSGISRLSQYQFDMVRLGIGLYGIDPGNEINQQLKLAVTLRATISQIKTIKPGRTVGYGRHGKAEKEMTLATLSIGYADGYSRAFSKGIGKVLVNGKLASVVGNVCMDMTMVDVTGIEVNEGDEAIIFGEDLSVSEVATWIKTIPYEILTSTSDRVKRVFFAESI